MTVRSVSIALGLGALVSFGTGMYGFDRGVRNAYDVAERVAVNARADQLRADTEQFDQQADVAKAEFERRLSATTIRNIAHDATTKDIPMLVPRQKACVISASAMTRLNDSSLIGKDAQ